MHLSSSPYRRVLVAGALAAALFAPVAPASAQAPAESADDAYIVIYDRAAGDVDRETDQRERSEGFKARFRYREIADGFAARLSERQRRALERDPDVALVTRDRPVQAYDVPLAPGETAPSGVRRVEAGSTTTASGASTVNVAVIDTGVDLDHPDLNVVAGKNCTGSGAPDDDNGHGTHVAGTIGATNTGAGLTGVAPGTRIYAVKVLNSAGSGSWSQIICGIDWATATRSDADPTNDIAVSNMSLGGGTNPLGSCGSTSDALHRAVCASTAAGVLNVVAAGNSTRAFDTPSSPDGPAVYPEALTVSAVSDSDGAGGAAGPAPSCRSGEVDDRYATFSNWAATATGQSHTIAGPGVCINSTWPNGGYSTISGTSMASPHLAGVAALCLGEAGGDAPCAGMTPALVIQKLRTDAQARTNAEPAFGFTGDPLRPVSGRYYGFTATTTPAAPPAPDTTPPTVSSVSPADGATGVATSTKVSATFSEAMDQAATAGAFSLVRTSDGAPVAGSFAWSGNTLTFTPSAALATSTGYTATVGTGARDAAGNALEPSKTWSFTTAAPAPTTVTAYPATYTRESGTLYGGSVSSLTADDNNYLQINSTTSGTRTTSWYGTVRGVTNSLTSLRAIYRGKNTASCSQTVSVWNWTTGAWVSLDSRSVGTSEVTVDRSVSGTLNNVVSGSADGDVRVRIRCTRSASFRNQAEQLRIVYTRP